MNNESNIQKKAWLLSDSMFDLQKKFKAGLVEREDADTEANIVGKNLKALSIIWADQMRQDAHVRIKEKIEAIENEK
jgi:hypothetical protein